MNEDKKVIIGIVSKHYPKEIYKNRKTDTYIRDEVKQAIFDNGGVAIGILPTESQIKYSGDDEWKGNLLQEERGNLISQIKLCNGIILQGGLETDEYENVIAKYCYDNDIPILGICAGQNSIARAIGGTICKISNPEKHDKSYDYVHKIKIDKDSHFYNIVKTNEMMVNSRHKRTIKECKILDVVAICEDGYPDVIEAKNKKFYMGVRFHPESLYKKDLNMNNIFKSFIESCK